MARTLLRLFDRLLEAFCTLFGLALGVLIALMCADVFLRYFRLNSLPWLIEMTEHVMYAGTFLAAPWVLRRGSHVRVDILMVSLPKRATMWLEQAVDLVGLAIALVLVWYGTAAVRDAFRGDMVQYKTWNYPEWVLLLAIPLGAMLLAIEFALRIARVEGVVTEDYDPTKRASI
jgi:TRAP-type C4-dicarboxylate transport system permease small subunit